MRLSTGVNSACCVQNSEAEYTVTSIHVHVYMYVYSVHVHVHLYLHYILNSILPTVVGGGHIYVTNTTFGSQAHFINKNLKCLNLLSTALLHCSCGTLEAGPTCAYKPHVELAITVYVHVCCNPCLSLTYMQFDHCLNNPGQIPA